jgi:epoxyqueuosine reductase QueG
MGIEGTVRDVDLLEQKKALLLQLARDQGISAFGIADLASIRENLEPPVREKTGKLRFGISLGFRLSDAILEDLENGPTLLYKHHYKAVNYRLDQVALLLAHRLQQEGYSALPIPSSQVIDWERQKGYLSHRLVARQAGLGWIGRSNLLVNPEHGGRLRLVTILTDMPLPPDLPLDRTCSSCRACMGLCPAGAITERGYELSLCLAKLREFSSWRGIGVLICGMCVKACPLGQPHRTG